MTVLTRSALVALPPAEVYALIADVASYPQFVPGCAGAEILSQQADEVLARLKVQKGPLSTHLVTRNRMTPHSGIHMELVEGPLSALTGAWQLTPVGEAGCRIEFTLEYSFSSPLKAAVLEPLITGTVGAMVQAFVGRAQQRRA